MELARRKNYKVTTVAGDMRDFGKLLADGLRSSVDIAGRAINVIATRGGADEVVTLEEDRGAGTDPMMWYAFGAAAILVVAVAVKRKKR
jgi:hypothetical protein